MTKRKPAASRAIVLDVTQEIINVAVQRDSGHCVIADALQAARPDVRAVSVDLQTIRYTDPAAGKRYIYLTPAPAQAVLVNFDQGHPPEPFRMRLGRPAQIMRVQTRKRPGKRDEPAPDDGLPPGTQKVMAPVTARKPDTIPVILGGDYPPTAALSNTRGRRRTFGLRTLKP